MRREKDKLNRVKPVIKVRESALSKESQLLAEIRREKQRVVSAMQEKQMQYINGVEDLNQHRTNSPGYDLSALERGLDKVLQQWSRLVRESQTLDNKEAAQLAQVRLAERELKAIETLAEKYQAEFRKAVSTAEQKELDEFSLRRFTTNK